MLQSIDPEKLGTKEALGGTHESPWEWEIEYILWVD